MTASRNLPPLAVTGATGAVGGLVARALAEAGVEQRLLVRTPAKAPDLDGAVVLPMSYSDRDASERALAGVETLLMVSGSESADRVDQHYTFIDAAVAAGVRHIVYTSFAAAADDSTFTLGRDHYATEQRIRAAGITYTFLRDNLYLESVTHWVGDDGVIRGPAGGGRAALVARQDVARVAAAVLLDPASHAAVSYDITGPEAVSLDEVAAALASHRGEPIVFHDETVPEAYASRQRWGAPDWQVDAWVSTYLAIARGDLAAVSPDVERVTGRPALSLSELLAMD